MPFIVEDGTGVPGATAYVSVEDADAIHEDALYGDEWLDAALDINRKQRALMVAARMMDDLWIWKWPSATDSQGLDFPLTVNESGEYLPSSVIRLFPDDIKRANAEVALWLIQNPPGSGGAPTATQTVEGVKLGPMELSFAVPNDPEPVAPELFPVSVARYLKQYGSMGGSGNTMRLRR
jgi:hypothetical protein